MNEWNSIENSSTEYIYPKAIGNTVLSEQKKTRLSEIIGFENYFYQEISQRKSYIKKIK